MKNETDFGVVPSACDFGSHPAPIGAGDPEAGPMLQHPSARLKLSKQPIYAAERKRRLLQILKGIDRRAANGWPVAKAIRRAARRWEGKCFKSAPGRKVNFSGETLTRLYYAWLSAERNAGSLDLHYAAPAKKVSPDLGILVTEHCLASDVQSMSAAIRLINASGALGDSHPGRDTIRRSVEAKDRAALGEIFKGRKALRRAEKQFRDRRASK